MKRVEVHIAEGETNRRLGTLEYDELRGKPAARASHGNVNEDNFDGSRQANGNRSRFRRGGIG